MKILIATKNPGKAREIKEFLGNSFQTVALTDFSDAPDVEETGETFEKNALLKAQAYFKWSGIPSITDDGGLEIDFLNGEPGVKSRRWPGYEATDEELIEMVLKKLQNVPKEKRTSRLRTLGLYFDGKNILSRTASISGSVVESYCGHCEKGYPFRAIFLIPQLNKLYQDLTYDEHEKINHRRIVYSQLAKDILALSK